MLNFIRRVKWVPPELSTGLPAGTGSGSLISTTTQSDIEKVFAMEAACSSQHLTTCSEKGSFLISEIIIWTRTPQRPWTPSVSVIFNHKDRGFVGGGSQ